ncbi:EamA family transporter [Carboxydothermus ferrireducens]|uniref:Membrane protein n=1 Tax=Carboxydothermus ferrireducens DSM 11255 TaxID=1119529 RepID=A0ABX2RBA5_9THEO|nr:EamA family transporter [Carboxydothermus ferrireducens]NYE58458.1 putative membrane protein [Carboxydothermus ferrireducens DSM 11255]
MYLLLAVICAFMIALGQIFWKLGMERMPFTFTLTGLIKFFMNGYIISGIFMYVTETFLWFWLLAREQVSKIYPALSLSYIFVLVMARVFLKEKIVFTQVIGILLVVLGVSLIVKK